MKDQQKQYKIGNYLLRKTIGQGTFGKVKMGIHILTGQPVAVKILVKEKIIDVADVERVSRQIHILKLARHPNIIQLYQIMQTQKHLFIVMQYVQKGQLFDYIVDKNRLSQKQACLFFKQIISGIAYISQLNIVHRDLKPENLLIDWKNNLKIVDFGLSNTYKPGQLLKTACGSPCYAPPQMINNKRYNGLQVDLWSSGIILFTMVCGYLPFQDDNTSQLYKKILSGQFVLPSDVSPQFCDLIENVLNIQPSKRYRVAQILSHPWCKLTNDSLKRNSIVMGYHRIPVDNYILQKLKQYNFDLQYAQRCIQTNKHNHITTTYYLLMKRQSKNGYNSKFDINSINFDAANIQPFKRPYNQTNKYNFFGMNDDTALFKLQNIQVKSSQLKKFPLSLKSNSIKQKAARTKDQIQSAYSIKKSPNKHNNSYIFTKGHHIFDVNKRQDKSFSKKRSSLRSNEFDLFNQRRFVSRSLINEKQDKSFQKISRKIRMQTDYKESCKYNFSSYKNSVLKPKKQNYIKKYS